MLSRLFFLLFCGIIAAHLGNAQKLPKGKKLNLKVHINATSDTLVMKFLSPNPNMKLEGFILGYGSNFFSNQYIQWPENGKSYITEVDAESRYLIAVKPNENLKKPCKEKNSVQKPLQLVIGTLTPTSVFLSWGILINPQFDWAALNKCPNDRFYTVRYREKEKNKDWLFQLCPTTEIVIDSLKPKTMYEFGVKDNSEGGIWSKSHNHKTIHKTKENEQIQNTYKLPKGSIQLASEDTKALIPITVVKQGIKNLTHLIQPESTGFPPATEESPVHREGPKKLSATTTTKVPKITKPKAGDKPGEPAELKTVEVPEIIKKPIPVPKGTQPPPAPQTSEESDIEDTKPVPKETSSLHSIPIPSTEAPQAEADSRQPISEIITTEAPHTYEQEKITLVSSDTPFIPKLATTPRPETEPETTAAYRTTSLSFTTNTPTSKRTESTLAYRTTSLSFTTNTPTSKRTESTLASKESRLFPTQSKTSPMPEATQPTPVLNETPQAPIHLLEETPATLVPNETQKVYAALTTESPFPKLDPKTTHRVPINLIRLHIFEDPKVTLVPDRTEKVISPKHRKTTESLPSTAVPMTTKRMPINLIRLHIIEDPTVTSAPSETPSTPKPTQSNKMSRSKPAPKPTQRVPINVISLQIFGEPEVALVPNTTQAPSLPKTTQRTESPPSKPVPNVTQKVSPHKTKKPQPTARPRAKPAPYKLQLSSSRPRTSGRPRSRPAQNGTTQGSIRAKPTGDLSWMTGTIPGGRAYDSTKLLGVSRNISMEQNNTGKKTFSVSSAPLLPVRPTSLRRRPLPPNVTGRPGSTGNVLMPRAPSTARPNRTVVSVAIKTPKKQPTLPPEEDIVDTTVFSPSPKSEIDSLGKTRYTAPHVKYMSKEDTVPCSITESLRHFPVEEATNHEISSAPQSPPSNLTIVTVEGCPSFVILDWEQPDNDTATEYEVISTENGAPLGKDQSIITTNQTYSTVENLKPNASYEFKVKPKNPLGEGPVSTTVEFSTESADPRVSEPVTGGKDAIWTEIKFKSDSYSECKGKQYVKRTWYKKFVGIQLCNSLRYKIYLSNSLSGTFYNIGDQSGYGEDHCQFVDSFLDGRTGQQLSPDQLTTRKGFYRAVRQQSVEFGEMGGQTHIRYVHWYECGIAIPGKW